MLLFGTLWWAGYLPAGAPAGQGDTIHGILTVALAIVLIYLLGLIAHGVQRLSLWLLWFFFRTKKPGNPIPPWYTDLKKDNPRHELAMYFWYMRATCWNLAVAVIPVAFIYCRNPLEVLEAVLKTVIPA